MPPALGELQRINDVQKDWFDEILLETTEKAGLDEAFEEFEAFEVRVFSFSGC